MLRVDVDEVLAKLFEYRKLSRRVVDEGTTLSVGLQLSAYNAFCTVEVKVVLFEETIHLVGRKVEHRLDGAFRLARLYAFGVGTLTEQQPDGAEDY